MPCCTILFLDRNMPQERLFDPCALSALPGVAALIREVWVWTGVFACKKVLRASALARQDSMAQNVAKSLSWSWQKCRLSILRATKRRAGARRWTTSSGHFHVNVPMQLHSDFHEADYQSNRGCLNRISERPSQTHQQTSGNRATTLGGRMWSPLHALVQPETPNTAVPGTTILKRAWLATSIELHIA